MVGAGTSKQFTPVLTLNIFPLKVLPRVDFFDYHPLLIELTDNEVNSGPRLLKFEYASIIEDYFDTFMELNRNNNHELVANLDQFKEAANSWNLHTFKSLTLAKNKLMSRISGIQQVIQNGNGHLGLENIEEHMWFWRPKIKWLFDGDMNTRFYHVSIIQRRRRKNIKIIKNDDGVWVDDQAQIQHIYVQRLVSTFVY